MSKYPNHDELKKAGIGVSYPGRAGILEMNLPGPGKNANPGRSRDTGRALMFTDSVIKPKNFRLPKVCKSFLE